MVHCLNKHVKYYWQSIIDKDPVLWETIPKTRVTLLLGASYISTSSLGWQKSLNWKKGYILCFLSYEADDCSLVAYLTLYFHGG